MTANSEKNKPELPAVHASEGPLHFVGCAIRVLVVKDDGQWFARGLEIDFAASGSTLEEVKKNFERDLLATFHENLRIHGNIRSLLTTAPQSVWTEYWAQSRRLSYTQVSLHLIPQALEQQIPFKELYFAAENEAEAA